MPGAGQPAEPSDQVTAPADTTLTCVRSTDARLDASSSAASSIDCGTLDGFMGLSAFVSGGTWGEAAATSSIGLALTSSLANGDSDCTPEHAHPAVLPSTSIRHVAPRRRPALAPT